MAKKKTKSSAAKSNGAHVAKVVKVPATKASSGAGWLHLVLTVLSFLVGVLTPPVLHYIQVHEDMDNAVDR